LNALRYKNLPPEVKQARVLRKKQLRLQKKQLIPADTAEEALLRKSLNAQLRYEMTSPEVKLARVLKWKSVIQAKRSNLHEPVLSPPATAIVEAAVGSEPTVNEASFNSSGEFQFYNCLLSSLRFEALYLLLL
jgi:hypothetical protein